MSAFYSPDYKQKEIINIVITHAYCLLLVTVTFFLQHPWFYLISFAWLFFIFSDITVYIKRTKGWLAKFDDEFINFYNQQSKIPVHTIHK